MAPAQIFEIVHALTGRDHWDDVIHTHRYTLLEDGTLRKYALLIHSALRVRQEQRCIIAAFIARSEKGRHSAGSVRSGHAV